MDVEAWEEPSGRRDNSSTAKVVADTLRAHKDQWAIIDEQVVPEDKDAARRLRAQSSNRASLIKQGRLAAFTPRGTFEAVSRSVDLDTEGNSVLNGAVIALARESTTTEGGAPVGDVVPKVRVFARYLGEEFAQPTPERKPRKPKAKEEGEAAPEGGEAVPETVEPPAEMAAAPAE